jgi:hypothetical protein
MQEFWPLLTYFLTFTVIGTAWVGTAWVAGKVAKVGRTKDRVMDLGAFVTKSRRNSLMSQVRLGCREAIDMLSFEAA